MRHYNWFLFLEAKPFDHFFLLSIFIFIVVNFPLSLLRGLRLAIWLILTLEKLFDHCHNTYLSWIVLLNYVKFSGLFLLRSGLDHSVQVQVVDEHILLLSVNLAYEVRQLAANISIILIVTLVITLLVVISGM